MFRTWKSLVRNAVLCGIAVGLCLSASTPALGQEATPHTTLKLYHLKYVDAQEAGSVVTQVLKSDDNLRIAVDARTNALVVGGLAETQAQIEALLQALDQESVDRAATKPELPPVQVRVIWLASGVKGNPLPKGLEPVVKELEGLGIAELFLAGQMMINVGEPAKKFSIESRPRLGEESFDLAFQGVLSSTASGVPQMDAAVVCSLASGEKIANIATTIETPLDQYIVLGTTVADGSNSVFVLQLMPQKSTKAAAKQ